MQLPYVSAPDEALSAVHWAAAVTLTVLVWSRPLQSRLASALLVTSMWVAALVPRELKWIAAARLPTFERVDWLLGLSSLLVVLSTLFQRRRAAQVSAVLGAWALGDLGHFVTNSDFERAVLQVVYAGLIYGLARPPTLAVESARRREGISQIVVSAVGLLAATFVAVYVLDRFIASGDEWGYQFQADLFGHGKAYGSVPACPSVHETYWIYYWMGRAFCQYTPSWPLIVAPFQRLGIYWLASPVVFAVGLVGVYRLAWRAAECGTTETEASSEARAAGVVAALLLSAAGSMLLNAGSLFSHALVCALFAWAVESLFTVTGPGLAPRQQIGWGFAFGALVALLGGARPADAAAMSPAIAAYGIYALVKGRAQRRAVVASVVGFLVVAVPILIILRLQLGRWFQTGYSLTEIVRPWGAVQFSWPKADEWKYGIPLASIQYCFWPCSLAVAAVGSVAAFRRSPAVVCVLWSGALLQFALYSSVSAGRHFDWGYGPRYLLPTIVPMAVFSGVAWAPLMVQASRRSPAAIFRACVLVGAAIYGTWTVGRLLYPVAMDEIRVNSAPYRAVRQAGLKHAVVVFKGGLVAQDPADLTQNLATDPNPNVVYLMEGPPPDMECARRLYPGRKWYRATGRDVVQLTPLD